MMRKLDNRGMASFEFVLVFVPLFTLMFVIFDLGRYAITQQSLYALANAGARAFMIKCYTPINPVCSAGDPLPQQTDKQDIAPFLFFSGLAPNLNVAAPGANSYTVTASQPDFTMLMPIWGGQLDKPSASTTIPF
jgi:hypothetical protein